MTRETHKRSVVKSLGWRAIGVLLLAALSVWALEKGGDRALVAGFITVGFHSVRFLLYWWWERLWQGIRWGLETMPGCVVWMTGLPCSGKSTIARELERVVGSYGRRVVVLDGDVLRRKTPLGAPMGLCADLGFSPKDRHENLRRIREVAHLIAEAGAVAVVAAITPYQSDRAMALGRTGRTLLVHVATPAETCERRDVKGMWAKARAGEIDSFTGVSAPFESLHKTTTLPHVQIDTDDTVQESAERIIVHLRRNGWL